MPDDAYFPVAVRGGGKDGTLHGFLNREELVVAGDLFGNVSDLL